MRYNEEVAEIARALNAEDEIRVYSVGPAGASYIGRGMIWSSDISTESEPVKWIRITIGNAGRWKKPGEEIVELPRAAAEKAV